MSNTLTSKVSGRMSSRGWALALGIGAVALAAILLVVYLDRYRARVGGENAPTPVLQANRLIPAGTPGTLVASQSMYTPTTLPQKEVVVGAIADPAVPQRSRGGHGHLPRSRSSPRPTSRRATPHRSTPRSRARSARSRSRSTTSTGRSRSSWPVTRSTSTSGVAGVVKLFRPNVKVLAVPSQPGPSGGGNLVLRMETSRRGAVRVRGRQHAALVRPPPGRRCEAHEAVAGQRVDGAEVDKEL